MEKHTPGPYVRSFNGAATWTIMSRKNGEYVGSAARQQDAALFEAAPDMYGRLELIEELLCILKSAVARVAVANLEGNNIMSAWLPDARAAIAKAEGGKS